MLKNLCIFINESSPTERTVCYESFVEYALMFNQVKSLWVTLIIYSMFAVCYCENINLSFSMQNLAIIFIVSLTVEGVSKNFIGWDKGSDFDKTLL